MQYFNDYLFYQTASLLIAIPLHLWVEEVGNDAKANETIELGYPHEIILVSSIKAKEVVQSAEYTSKTRIWAAMLLNLIGEKISYVEEIPDKRGDIEFQLLASIISGDIKQILIAARDWKAELIRKKEDYEKRKSVPSLVE